ncbi:type I CRISPR-associated protein Cas7 [Clostridium sp. 19966]|uniref:type I CRISPR-associated protein Cas7 n=1 Tax=Clostridium sp. 19966 TaxID=2768166 RepID=UPI0028DEBFA2|nr:type I CRISPR-associated protein Cas7 [Clostridium sp. 19966]MDT8719414.1 type I CRISPR-associated protein Cas7 [Clostridium sp. 19966]
MNKRVYGVIGIKSIMANWNADFSGNPKSISTGEIFGSDKALKYPMKKMWEEQGEAVLYVKSLKLEPDKKEGIKVRPKSLKERYEEIFQVKDLKNEKDNKQVLTNLFKAIDVKSFGATFAEEGNNISITGAVQIGQGFNKYADATVEEQNILSPFRVENEKNKKDDEEANFTTLGTKIVSSEAHYFYPFVITPSVYNNYAKLGVTEGYTEEDYKKFKEAALVSATAFNTNAKLGCENEFSIFIETDIDLYLPDLAQYISFEKAEGKDRIVLADDAAELINTLSGKIKSIEIYYNPIKTELNKNIEKAKYFNIFTREVL